MKNMENEKLADDIIQFVGGKENISNVQRCATRLRFVLKHTPENAMEEISKLPKVITVVEKGGQFQVVLGPQVGVIFDIVSDKLKLDNNFDDNESQDEKKSLLNRIIGMMSAVFAPFIYVLAAAGLLQGLLIILTRCYPQFANTGTYEILNLTSWAPFTFLPILIAYTASKHFKCNQYVALAVCLPMVSESWTAIISRIANGESIRFLFANVSATTYTSTVLPPLILIGCLAYLERFLNKYIPEIVRSLLVPFICILLLVPLNFTVIGPITQYVSDLIAYGYTTLYNLVPWLAAGIVGFFWQVIVIFGIHWGIVPIVLANFSAYGCDSIQVFITMAIISQMAAAFGVAIKSKNKQLKTMALSAGITAVFGVTEPTIYGITLPRKKPFIIACIWAGIGSIVASLFHSMNYVYAGLPSLLTIVNSISSTNPSSFLGCIIGAGIAIVGTIASIVILGWKEKEEENQTEENQTISVYSPLEGTVKRLEDVDDPTFSQGLLGKGIAILPNKGEVIAPFDAEVVSLFPTNHAIGLKASNGLEVLIHIGLETVKKEGEGFMAQVKQGDKVKKGDLLVKFDLETLKNEFNMITPVVVTNSDDYEIFETDKMNKEITNKEIVLKANKKKER